MLTDVAGVAVGHWTDPVARTGCTVVLLPEGSVASGEVRGGAPGTREWDLLSPERMMSHVDAVVLTGGSAYGLAACDGVVRWCSEQGRGFVTRAGPVPIVVGTVLFDLAVGNGGVRPGPEQGYDACVAASSDGHATGAVGAGTGATVGSWRGPEAVRPGGLGASTERFRSDAGQVTVSALMAVNAYGDVLPPGTEASQIDMARLLEAPPPAPFQNTTIGVVVTDAPLDKRGCLLLAQSAHDGLARALEPVHTTVDGDAIVVVSTSFLDPAAPPSDRPPASFRLDGLRAMAARATTAAVRAAVPGVPRV
ncbi:MAG TPA: P1 family peptidase [Acidimicrobiales bacterium]|nr:P1 family peptidase [Acidimicrobiales bacterium]